MNRQFILRQAVLAAEPDSIRCIFYRFRLDRSLFEVILRSRQGKCQHYAEIFS